MEDGFQVFKEEEIAAIIEKYFCKLFIFNMVNLQYMEEVIIEVIIFKIIEVQNEEFVKIFLAEEIRVVFFFINFEKVFGFDGFLLCFF